MPVQNCYICDSSPNEKQLQAEADLTNGDYCPVCHRATCARHLRVVRFRWRESRQVDSAKVCEECKRTYAHRYWDSARRDWIS